MQSTKTFWVLPTLYEQGESKVMRLVLGRLLQCLVAISLSAAMIGCATQPAPGSGSPSPSPGGLTVSLLSSDGPRAIGPPNMVAARSVPELKALLHSLRDVLFHDPDGWDAFAGRQGQVFIALAAGYCNRVTTVTATTDSDGVVQVDYKTERSCSPGAGAAALPSLNLVSIPRPQLGSGVVTLQITGSYGRARVDLRQPDFTRDPATVSSDAMQAVAAIRQQVAMGTRAPIRELDLMRWPDNALACAPMSASVAALPVVGYIVVVDKGPGGIPQPEEFHWSAGKIVDCGPISGV